MIGGWWLVDVYFMSLPWIYLMISTGFTWVLLLFCWMDMQPAYPCHKIASKIMLVHGISLQVWNELPVLSALQQQFVVNIISFRQRTVYKEWFHTQSFNLKMTAYSEQLISWTWNVNPTHKFANPSEYILILSINWKTKYPLAKRFEFTKKLLPPIFPNLFQTSL